MVILLILLSFVFLLVIVIVLVVVISGNSSRYAHSFFFLQQIGRSAEKVPLALCLRCHCQSPVSPTEHDHADRRHSHCNSDRALCEAGIVFELAFQVHNRRAVGASELKSQGCSRLLAATVR